MEKTWCVYTLADSRYPDDVRYVGITSNADRRYKDHIKSCGKTYKDRWVRKVLESGGDIFFDIISNFLTKSLAHSMEVELIKKFRDCGVSLVNTTDGGEGATGYVHSSLEIYSRRIRGITQMTEEKKKKMALGRQSDDWLLKMKAKMAITMDTEFRINRAKKNRQSVSGRTPLSGFRGVSLLYNGRYRAWIRVDGCVKSLGCFDCPIQAARHRDSHELYYFGEDSVLNFSDVEACSAMTISTKRNHKKKSKSGYLGVIQRGVYFYCLFKRKKISKHESAEEAAKAYDDAAFAEYGHDCYLNFPDRFSK